jgi:hypothetical protein
MSYVVLNFQTCVRCIMLSPSLYFHYVQWRGLCLFVHSNFTEILIWHFVLKMSKKQGTRASLHFCLYSKFLYKSLMMVRRTETCSLFIAHTCMAVLDGDLNWYLFICGRRTGWRPSSCTFEGWEETMKVVYFLHAPWFLQGRRFCWNDSTVRPFVFLFKGSCEEVRSIRLNDV